jgi:hypothetical protein
MTWLASWNGEPNAQHRVQQAAPGDVRFQLLDATSASIGPSMPPFSYSSSLIASLGSAISGTTPA